MATLTCFVSLQPHGGMRRVGSPTADGLRALPPAAQKQLPEGSPEQRCYHQRGLTWQTRLKAFFAPEHKCLHNAAWR